MLSKANSRHRLGSAAYKYKGKQKGQTELPGNQLSGQETGVTAGALLPFV